MKKDPRSREDLLQEIEGLQMLCQQLLQEKEQETKLDYAWTGNLGHWYWNIKANHVTFNPLKAKAIGYDPQDLDEPIGYQFFTQKLHPDDYEKTMQNMRDHLAGTAPVYEVEYRIRHRDGSYRWFYDRGRITQRDDKGAPLFLAGIVFDITDRRMQQESLVAENRRLELQSTMDELTKVFNHRAIMEYLQSAMKQSEDDGTSLSVIMMDIDDFKKVNDSRGHLFGDDVLKTSAALMRESTRNQDRVGRYGGEEFLIVLPGSDASNAKKIGTRICRKIKAHDFDGCQVTISGGVASFSGESRMKLIEQADQNLYRAKQQGKDQVES